LHNKLAGCGASEAYASGPGSEEEANVPCDRLNMGTPVVEERCRDMQSYVPDAAGVP
jgi:hypothetical protein